MPIRLVIFLTSLLVALELFVGSLYEIPVEYVLTAIGIQLAILVIVVSVMGRKSFKTDAEFRRDCAKSCRMDDE